MGSTLYDYHAKVARVVDGDTLEVEVSLGFHLTLNERVRLAGINAPEIHSLDADEKRRGLLAQETLVKLCEGKNVTIKTSKARETEKYGRWLAEVYLDTGVSVVQAMLDSKTVLPWDGQGKKPI